MDFVYISADISQNNNNNRRTFEQQLCVGSVKSWRETRNTTMQAGGSRDAERPRDPRDCQDQLIVQTHQLITSLISSSCVPGKTSHVLSRSPVFKRPRNV